METPIPVRNKLWSRSSATGPSAVSSGEAHEDGDHIPAPATIEALFRQSYKSIVQALALAGGDQVAAEDATQEAFTQAWVRWNYISRYDNPGAWVRRVAINKLRNAHRSRLRGESAAQRLGTTETVYVGPVEAEADLVEALQRLPYKQRICAVLYYVEGLSTAEVAQSMGISQGSVSQHLSRARSALRSRLEESS